MNLNASWDDNNNRINLNWNQNNQFNYPISNYKLEVAENNTSFIVVPNSIQYFLSNIQTSKKIIIFVDN